MRNHNKTVIYRQDYRPPNAEILMVDLDIALSPMQTRIYADLHIRMCGDGPLFLHGQDLYLQTIAIDKVALVAGDYTHDETGLTLHAPPQEFHLQTNVIIAPCHNTHLEGIYLSDGIYTTQCEPEGFRHISFMLDRPDVSAAYQVMLTVDDPNIGDDFVLLSNGNPGSSGRDSLGRRYAFWFDPFPKPTYLFAIVAGEMGLLHDQFIKCDGRDVGLYIYYPPSMPGRAHYAMDALKRAMRWDEERFGLEYDLERFHIVAIDDFNMGAMENKSLNIFNAKYLLADPQSATDDDYGFVESIVAHEYFHN
ncbi:MAG: M1 family aminopeptidase, partial [Pseudomonadota bacterium]